MSTGLSPHAEAHRIYEDEDNWYVFWESGIAYGSIGWNMTFEEASELADKVKKGEVKP